MGGTMNQAEVSVIGSILISPECCGEVVQRLAPSDFLVPELAALFGAARELWLDGSAVDAVTVVHRAGSVYEDLARDCMDKTPTAANVLDYCDLVKSNAALTRMQGLALQIASASSLVEAREACDALTAARGSATGIEARTWAELLSDFFTEQTRPAPEFITTGIDFLDQETFIQRGHFGLLCARPGVGKTALALQMAFHMAKTQRVGYFYLEMRREELTQRAVAMQFGEKLRDIQTHKLKDMEELAVRAASSSPLPFEVFQSSGRTVAEIRAVALARRLDVVIIDYVQLLKPPRDLRNEVAELEEISVELTRLAQTGCLVLGLAQLRRPENPKQKYAWPTLSEIKGSSQFEQDTDFVMMLGLEKGYPGRRNLILPKNRQGLANLSVLLSFDGETQRFRTLSRRDEETEDKPERPLEPTKWKTIRSNSVEGQQALPF